MAEQTGAAMAQDRLDHRYPAGTRLVFWSERLAARQLRMLSEGLRAVCGPVVSYDGQSVVFAGKAADGSPWQIYETRLQAGHWRMVSSVPGGALDPAVLPDGSVIFSSPVPAGGAEPSQLYAQSLGGKPRQLTFCLLGAADPTVLLDGRILFVSSLPAESGRSAGLSLFTINNDGTEITGFACQHDPPANLRRPRQLPDGRLAFVASGLAPASADGTAEYVRMACPFQSRGKLLPNAAARYV